MRTCEIFILESIVRPHVQCRYFVRSVKKISAERDLNVTFCMSSASLMVMIYLLSFAF